MKVFLGSKGHNWPRSIEKLNISYQVWSHEGSTFWKNMTRNGHFSRPAETDPYKGEKPLLRSPRPSWPERSASLSWLQQSWPPVLSVAEPSEETYFQSHHGSSRPRNTVFGPIFIGPGCLSLTHTPFWNLTDVTLADEDTNSILTDNANRAIQGNVAMQIIQSGCQL